MEEQRKVWKNFFGGQAKIVKEPQLRYSKKGTPWCTTRLGFASGNDKEYLYFDAIAFDGIAERLSLCGKGDVIFVRDGSLRKSGFKDELELVIRDVDFFDEEDGSKYIEEINEQSYVDGDEPLGETKEIPF